MVSSTRFIKFVNRVPWRKGRVGLEEKRVFKNDCLASLDSTLERARTVFDQKREAVFARHAHKTRRLGRLGLPEKASEWKEMKDHIGYLEWETSAISKASKLATDWYAGEVTKSRRAIVSSTQRSVRGTLGRAKRNKRAK
jgi:hypothetical protein